MFLQKNSLANLWKIKKNSEWYATPTKRHATRLYDPYTHARTHTHTHTHTHQDGP